MGSFDEILRHAGFRATPGRIRLLRILAQEKKPLTVAEIQKKISWRLNEVTLYRALEALAAKGILDRTELGHSHAHYELVVVGKHHHHMVCTDCGTVEDLTDRNLEAAIEKITRKSSSFKKINNHSIELFGLCTSCA